MNSYTLGSVVRLSATVKTLSGAPVDAATATVRIRPPTGATIVAPPAHTGTGTYSYDYEPTVSGTHGLRIETTNPDSAAESSIYIQVSIVL